MASYALQAVTNMLPPLTPRTPVPPSAARTLANSGGGSGRLPPPSSGDEDLEVLASGDPGIASKKSRNAGSKIMWSKPMETALLMSLIECQDDGLRPNGTFIKAAWTRAVAAVKAAANAPSIVALVDKDRCSQKLGHFKKLWTAWQTFEAGGSGWGIDEVSNLPYNDQHVMAHPFAKVLFTCGLPYWNELDVLNSKTGATGVFATSGRRQQSVQEDGGGGPVITSIESGGDTASLASGTHTPRTNTSSASTTRRTSTNEDCVITSKRQKKRTKDLQTVVTSAIDTVMARTAGSKGMGPTTVDPVEAAATIFWGFADRFPDNALADAAKLIESNKSVARMFVLAPERL